MLDQSSIPQSSTDHEPTRQPLAVWKPAYRGRAVLLRRWSCPGTSRDYWPNHPRASRDA